MSLFGLASVVFNKGQSPSGNKGPLKALEGSAFSGTTLRYPIDVGNFDKGHYVVFYVREQENTQFRSISGRASATAFESAGSKSSVTASLGGFSSGALSKNPISNFSNQLLGKVNSGLNQINAATGGKLQGVTSKISQAASGTVNSINNLFGQTSSILSGDAAATTKIFDNSIKKITGGGLASLRTTVLTKDAIALYMPDTLQYTFSQSYDQLSLGGSGVGKALGAGSAVLDDIKAGNYTEAAASLASAAAGAAASNIATKLGGDAGRFAFTAATGKVLNPMLEMIYKSPNFRTFQFDFTFYPRDEKEAYEVQQIIEKFTFHQAPEITPENIFLIPPSEFDIRFYYGSAQNPNIPQIATCILTTIDVNYAPNGFSTYEVPGDSAPNIGRTGMPVAINLTLQFQEVTYLTKADFRSGDKASVPGPQRR